MENKRCAYILNTIFCRIDWLWSPCPVSWVSTTCHAMAEQHWFSGAGISGISHTTTPSACTGCVSAAAVPPWCRLRVLPEGAWSCPVLACVTPLASTGAAGPASRPRSMPVQCSEFLPRWTRAWSAPNTSSYSGCWERVRNGTLTQKLCAGFWGVLTCGVVGWWVCKGNLSSWVYLRQTLVSKVYLRGIQW